MMVRKVFLITCGCIFAVSACWACQFDLDCAIGSKCVKPSGSLYGVCKGGMNPGNDNDKDPAEFFPDLDGTIGDTCSFDVDCGVSNKCVKKSGSIYGVCMSK